MSEELRNVSSKFSQVIPVCQSVFLPFEHCSVQFYVKAWIQSYRITDTNMNTDCLDAFTALDADTPIGSRSNLRRVRMSTVGETGIVTRLGELLSSLRYRRRE